MPEQDARARQVQHPKEVLNVVQSLHDVNENWGMKALTTVGQQRMRNIKDWIKNSSGLAA